MSSTALQSPAGLSTSSRHYPTPTREGYHAQQQQPQPQVPITSTASSRSPRKSSTGAYTAGNPGNPGGAYANGPVYPSQPSTPVSSRASHASPVTASAAVAAAAVSMSDHHRSASASSERHRYVAPVAPPRTSSNRHEQTAASATPATSRRSAAPTGTDSPRRHTESRGVPAGPGSAREDPSRRRQQAQYPPEDYAQRSAAALAPARTNTSASAPAPHVASHQNSEIINSMVVTQDEVDIERERSRMAMAHANGEADEDDVDDAAPPPISVHHDAQGHSEDPNRGTRSRHNHSSRREKQIKFGEYILGNTIGEGEFGKVKLGWKQEGGVQVAIKLIKKDTLGNNPTRMAKIKREVAILQQLNHRNIVQLHKMEESEHHYGIVLEYASGGELFDYILNHRYLKDPAARRLFAQLISGVGYLHKKGIVHRDLKLENLLLDRNRNIIITDFGFANTFDPNEELTEEEEANLFDRDWVKNMGFDRVKPNGMRKADLMQTSCGSPCYAAPELVVSDSLYTGRKVDVWSCGVILYAMLAGYLPFDDDPKNPEGDNINLLYKYIVSTPLTFPEYVTPHARDLLRRILVPNPRERADLFEVARHSWLSEYSHVVEFITSSTTAPGDIQNMPPTGEEADGPAMGRSASVRASSKKAAPSPGIGGLASKQGTIDPEAEAVLAKQQKDNKRRTVQVEYVAPVTQTQRGEPAGHAPASTPAAGKTRARPITQGPVVVAQQTSSPSNNNKSLPREPSAAKEYPPKTQRESQRESKRPPSSHRNISNSATTASGTPRGNRTASEAAYMTAGSGSRPVTGGSMTSTASRAGPARASFGQPVPPSVAGTNAQGKIQQPTSGSARNYIATPPEASIGRPSISSGPQPQKPVQTAGYNGGNPAMAGRPGGEARGHRRSNTLGDITDKLLGRNGSIFGSKNRSRAEQRQSTAGGEKLTTRRYPPVSMSNTVGTLPSAASGSGVLGTSGDDSRTSLDSTARQSRRSFSIALGKKRSGSIEGSQTSLEKQHARRFSILAPFKSKNSKNEAPSQSSQATLPIQDAPADSGRGSVPAHASGPSGGEQSYEQSSQQPLPQQPPQQYADAYEQTPPATTAPGYEQGSVLHEAANNSQRSQYQYQDDVEAMQNADPRRAASRGGRVLQKNKRLGDGYEAEEMAKQHAGSSVAARRVMDFFRRRGKARGGED